MKYEDKNKETDFFGVWRSEMSPENVSEEKKMTQSI